MSDTCFDQFANFIFHTCKFSVLVTRFLISIGNYNLHCPSYLIEIIKFLLYLEIQTQDFSSTDKLAKKMSNTKILKKS